MSNHWSHADNVAVFRTKDGSERKHSKNFMERFEPAVARPKRSKGFGAWLSHHGCSMPTSTQTWAFCFDCEERTRLVDGYYGPFSECEQCGMPTGLTRIILKYWKDE